jgi:hypothetical protein
MIDRQELVRRAQLYCQRTGQELGQQLGYGVHGNVFALEIHTNAGPSAIKIHERERFYHRERDVYLRLADEGVTSISNCRVPRMLRHDDELWVIEMSIVKPPYVLDFAGAYLDEPPDYSEDILAEWDAEKREQFGSQWPRVQAVLRALEKHGVYLVDVNPGNIRVE